MNYRVIYEYTPSFSKVLFIVPLLIFVLASIFLIIGIRKYYKRFSLYRQLTMFFGYLLLAVSSIMAILMILKMPVIISRERQLKEALEIQNYFVVEGEIKNYSKEEINGKYYESFNIDTIRFELSNYLKLDGFPEPPNKIEFIKESGKVYKIQFLLIDGKSQIIKMEEKLN